MELLVDWLTPHLEDAALSTPKYQGHGNAFPSKREIVLRALPRRIYGNAMVMKVVAPKARKMTTM